MNKLSIIFDLDGTLWDSSYTIFIAWQEILKKYNISITHDQIKKVLGKTSEEIAKKLFYNTDVNLNILMNECEENENKIISKFGGQLYPNVIHILKKLSKQYELYIVSNCQTGYIEAFLEYYNINYLFKDYLCSSNIGLSKKVNINNIINRNHLKAKNCIYIGDTDGDSIASKEANVKFVHASYGFGKTLTYDYKISNISELLELSNIISKTIEKDD